MNFSTANKTLLSICSYLFNITTDYLILSIVNIQIKYNFYYNNNLNNGQINGILPTILNSPVVYWSLRNFGF